MPASGFPGRHEITGRLRGAFGRTPRHLRVARATRRPYVRVPERLLACRVQPQTAFCSIVDRPGRWSCNRRHGRGELGDLALRIVSRQQRPLRMARPPWSSASSNSRAARRPARLRHRRLRQLPCDAEPSGQLDPRHLHRRVVRVRRHNSGSVNANAMREKGRARSSCPKRTAIHEALHAEALPLARCSRPARDHRPGDRHHHAGRRRSPGGRWESCRPTSAAPRRPSASSWTTALTLELNGHMSTAAMWPRPRCRGSACGCVAPG